MYLRGIFASFERTIIACLGAVIFFGCLSFTLFYLFRAIELNNFGAKRVVKSIFDEVLHNSLEDVQSIDSNISKEGLLNLAKKRNRYSQVRLLDEDGFEVFRLNISDDIVKKVSEDKLQDKSKRYYYQEAKRLEVGEIYVSPLDYNIENGVVFKDEVTFRIVKKLSKNRSLVFNISSRYLRERIELGGNFIFRIEKDGDFGFLKNFFLKNYTFSKIRFGFENEKPLAAKIENWIMYIGFNHVRERSIFFRFCTFLVLGFLAVVLLARFYIQRVKERQKPYLAFEKLVVSSAVFSSTNKKGIITAVNSHFIEISGYSRSELVGNTYNVVNSGVHDQAFWSKMWNDISHGKVWTGIIKNKAKNGHYFWLNTIIAPILDVDKQVEGYFCFGLDVTRAVELEGVVGQLRDQNIKGINKLSAHLAHQFGTPLSVIQSSKEILEELLRNEMGRDLRLGKQLDNIQYGLDQIERINNIVRALGVKSRELPMVDSKANLLEVFKDSMDLVSQDLVYYDIKIDYLPSELDVEIRGHHILIMQVFVNLLNNSIHSLKNQLNREIRISTHQFEARIDLNFCDNGPGIPDDIRYKVFDPFFSTKNLNEGTGLGLSFNREVLAFFEATIDIAPSIDEGACFKISFASLES